MTGASTDTIAYEASLKTTTSTMNEPIKSRKGSRKLSNKKPPRIMSLDRPQLNLRKKVSPSKEKKTTPPRKSLQHFLSIDPKKRDSLISSNHDRTRKRRTAKNERKSSVLKSLVVLDIDEKDDDYLASSLRSNGDDSTHSRSSIDSSSTTGSGRRYMRRGSVTKHKLEADMVGMQPTQKVTDESDYGSDYDSGLDDAEKRRRRYLRRGSVTKHKLEANTQGIQPSQRASAGAESDYGSDYDSGVDEAEKARRRYLRRGSVTKYSLDYASVGAGMQPATAMEGTTAPVSKPRLPPPPSNDSFRLDGDDNIVKSPAKAKKQSASCHARMISPEKPPKSPSKKLKKRAGRASRRGSMKMPAKPNLGSDYYSANLNDSGHQRKHLYFDSHEEALSPRPTNVSGDDMSTEDTFNSLHSVASMPPASAASSHPIDPAKPRSGRKLIVDEAELYSSCQDLDYSDHLETIAPATPFQQNRTFERAESASSFESDESSEASFCNDYDEDYESKLPAKPVSRKPLLPPVYASAPKKLASSASSTSKSWKRVSKGKSKGKVNASGSISSADDSTASSTRSEDDPSFHKPYTPNMTMSSYAGFSVSPRNPRLKQAPGTARAMESNGILCTDKKKAGQTSKKSVRFDRITITEFPVILGDNPAVTAGAPVTIDWKPQGERNYSINAYERCRPIRRRRRRLLISVSNRAILLLAAGYSIDDIADASINAQQIKFSRQESMNASQYRERVSLMMENTNEALNDVVQGAGKKLKALIAKPVQHSATARTA